MMKCWNQSVSRRPTFSVLKRQLTSIYEGQAAATAATASQSVYVHEMTDNTFDIISSQPGEKC